MAEKTLIGIFGGSFNPIHYGHLGLARWVVEHTNMVELWLMVTPNNPLKDSDILADEQQRFAQAKQAVENNIREHPLQGKKKILVSDFEFALPRPNYTARTLQMLTDKYPDCKFALVIGEDNLRIFNRWKQWQDILRNHLIYVYPRHEVMSGGSAKQQTSEPAMSPLDILKLHAESDNSEFPNSVRGIYMLEGAPYFDISSTQIRSRHH